MVPKHSLLKYFTLTFTRLKSSKFEGSGPPLSSFIFLGLFVCLGFEGPSNHQCRCYNYRRLEMWRCPDYLFPVAESRGGIIQSGGHGKKIKLPAFYFFADLFFANMKAWLATARSGDSGKTQPLHYKAPTNKLLLSIIIVDVVVKRMVCTLSHS